MRIGATLFLVASAIAISAHAQTSVTELTASEIAAQIRAGKLKSEDVVKALAERIEKNPKIAIWRASEVAELLGNEALEAVAIRDLNTDDRDRIPATALFVLIGAEPHTSWLQGHVALDGKGYILTGNTANGSTTSFETDVPGVLAVGDVRSGSTKRVASAVGEGAMVISFVHRVVQAMREKAAEVAT